MLIFYLLCKFVVCHQEINQFVHNNFILNVACLLWMHCLFKFLNRLVCTICIGLAASMGAFLLSSGTKGKRFSLPNSEIMIHQPLGGAQGQATDIAIHAEQILKIKEKLNKILAKNTGKDYQTIVKDTDRDNFMSAEQALEYGLIDKIYEKRA